MRRYPVVRVFLLLWAMPAAKTALCLPPTAVVQIEEDVYSYKPADNGAGPMWCHGSTCLVRIGDELFASGVETLDIGRSTIFSLRRCGPAHRRQRHWNCWEYDKARGQPSASHVS